MTHVAAMGIRKGPYFQVYAPNQNENVYTNHFTGPLYGYERVIETFLLTERPYRLKPVNIYFHTYSASRRASLEALHRAESVGSGRVDLAEVRKLLADPLAEEARRRAEANLMAAKHLAEYREREKRNG